MPVPRFTTSVGKPASVRPTPRPQRTQQVMFPAPVGMNTMLALAAISPQECIYTYNLLPYELGLRSREGYIEWSNGTPPVRTVLPFVGNREDRFNDRLFAATDQGIFNISAQGVDPPSAYTWPTTGGNAGYCVYTHFTNDAGAHFLIVADETNGLTEYEEGTNTWKATPGSDITGLDPRDVFFVTSHKNRLWLVTEDSSSAYYLPTGAKAGTATEFNFGAQFREGGTLVGLYSWTVDGGDGVDDYLVALTREGGVVVYRGDDPANASTWSLVGVWYIGRVPAGHRAASQYGGQLFILCEHGVISLNELLRGATLDSAGQVLTDKITRVVRENLVQTLNQRGWELRMYPRENQYVISSPLDSNVRLHIDYVRNMTTNGWGLARGLPFGTGEVWQGDMYMADNDGSVWKWDGDRDRVTLAGDAGVEVSFSMLTSFQGQGNFIRGQFCRPYFLAARDPSFSVQARYDFDLAENDGRLVTTLPDLALWDTALWDAALWGGREQASDNLRGISGYGHKLAIALKGSAVSRVTLAALEVQVEPGGLL